MYRRSVAGGVVAGRGGPRSSGTRRSVALALIVVIAAVLLSGCLRTEVGVHVEGDNSGRIDLEVYFDQLTLNQANISVNDMIKVVEAATKSIDGAEVSAVSAVGAKGFRVSLPFDDYRQLTQSLTTGEYGGMSTRLFSEFNIVEGDEGHWSMSATVDPVGIRNTLSQIPANLSGSASQIDASTEFVFATTLPGKVLRSNADIVDGGTARWNLKGDAGVTTFSMENEPSGLTPLQMILIGVGVLFLVGFLLIFLTAAGGRRRRRRGGKKLKAKGPQDSGWGAPAAGGTEVLAPADWSSPPPYSSHGLGEAVPSSPPEGPAVSASAGVAAGAGVAAAAGVAQGPASPPLSPTAQPPIAPILHTVPQEPAVPQTYRPAPQQSAQQSGAIPIKPTLRADGSLGPPMLPTGFVPDAPIAFPDTHSSGPPPSSNPPVFHGEVPVPEASAYDEVAAQPEQPAYEEAAAQPVYDDVASPAQAVYYQVHVESEPEQAATPAPPVYEEAAAQPVYEEAAAQPVYEQPATPAPLVYEDFAAQMLYEQVQTQHASDEAASQPVHELSSTPVPLVYEDFVAQMLHEQVQAESEPPAYGEEAAPAPPVPPAPPTEP